MLSANITSDGPIIYLDSSPDRSGITFQNISQLRPLNTIFKTERLQQLIDLGFGYAFEQCTELIQQRLRQQNMTH